ncbi:creatininase family protein [Aggregicoccus sp. 17bor-14]|uniref:creatininase family protein n=1 Tax=Myxococcaceae TaxID=31 RepID=UPI00129C2992|nr:MULTISPECIES: creatininase family protein [Myxococcaceae]MBF5043669.1 creatininase family protein [Simulacricoccus sp. 17bor-14]MRI89427.1 creatininase family protein [Aggregicoccus sp. 17bor-14]
MSSPFRALEAAHLSWPRVRALARGGAVALLPVGSTEAHGPHLPLAVDVLIAQAVCREVARRLESERGVQALLFPPVAYGLTDFAASFSGTVSLAADTARALLADALAGIAGHGFAATLAVNHHLEPAHFRVVHEAAKAARERSGARVLAPDHRRPPTGPLLGREFTHGGSHAGCYETSLMLAAAPELVDQDALAGLAAVEVDLPARIKAGARDFHEAGGPEAYFGDPRSASAEEGKRLLGVLADAVLSALDAP